MMKYSSPILSSLFMLILVVLVASQGCFKPELFSDIPAISNARISPNIIYSSTDEYKIIFDFEDGDGNLGNDSINNVFIKDLRDGSVSFSRIPYVSPEGNVKSITGTSTRKVSSECCIPLVGIPCDPSATYPQTNEIVYEIYVVDEDGNVSNTITSNPLTMVCPQ